jgi:hypothetical protein
MNKRKSLSLDVMQQFMKDPSTIERSSNADISTEVDTENTADISADLDDDVLADISTEVDTETAADISTDVDDDLFTDLGTEVDTETAADIGTQVNAEIIADSSTEVDRTKKSRNPHPQQQIKSKSNNLKPEKTKLKRGSNATKAEESSLSIDVIETFKIAQKEATTRFTVDLPQSQHQQFAIVSKKLNTNMSTLARVLIEKFLTEIERDGLL